MSNNEQYFEALNILEKIKELFKDEHFRILIEQKEGEYFPDFVKQKLYEYTTFYNKNLKTLIDDSEIFSNKESSPPLRKIKVLSDAINKTIDTHYDGNIHKASSILFRAFNKTIALKNVGGVIYPDKVMAMNTEYSREDYPLYRGRKEEIEKPYFSKIDLFHIPFEERYKIRTNRYSISGNPALYFGDSTYVCWKEMEVSSCNIYYYSKFKINSIKPLKIISLKRVEDCILSTKDLSYFDHKDWENKYNELALLFINTMQYLSTFPLILACTIKVKNPTDSTPNQPFKPEYIIPQLLIQFVQFQKSDIIGIKYPSTKVDYSKLENTTAYNYAFPVKKSSKDGFCKTLVDTFQLTEPTKIYGYGNQISDCLKLEEKLGKKAFSSVI